MKFGPMFLTAVAALALASCGPREGADSDAQGGSGAPAVAATDPNPHYVGVPNTQFQSGGTAVAANTVVRDVTYRVDSDVRIEVFITSTDTPLHVQLITGVGEEQASADVQPGQEVRLEGTPSEGEPNNIIRVTRDVAGPEGSAFSFRIRTLPLQ